MILPVLWTIPRWVRSVKEGSSGLLFWFIPHWSTCRSYLTFCLSDHHITAQIKSVGSNSISFHLIVGDGWVVGEIIDSLYRINLHYFQSSSANLPSLYGTCPFNFTAVDYNQDITRIWSSVTTTTTFNKSYITVTAASLLCSSHVLYVHDMSALHRWNTCKPLIDSIDWLIGYTLYKYMRTDM